MIDWGYPSILKSNLQARMLVLFLCGCALPFLSYAWSQFGYWPKEVLEVQQCLYCESLNSSENLFLFCFFVLDSLSPSTSPSHNTRGDKPNFLCYNLLCYPSELSAILFMFKQLRLFLSVEPLPLFFCIAGWVQTAKPFPQFVEVKRPQCSWRQVSHKDRNVLVFFPSRFQSVPSACYFCRSFSLCGVHPPNYSLKT